MNRTLFLTALLCTGVVVGTLAQSGQSPTMQQSTSTADQPSKNQPTPKLKKPSRREQMKMQQGLDTTLPKDRKQKRLRPDSLRRGGAVKVDTI